MQPFSEDQLQAKCFQLTWNHFPFLRKKFWAVPNGGDRNLITAKKLQATGVIPGVWDIHFFFQGRFTIVEMKVEPNILSQPQIDWGTMMAEEGANKFVVYDVEEWKHVVWFDVLRWGKSEYVFFNSKKYIYDEWINVGSQGSKKM